MRAAEAARADFPLQATETTLLCLRPILALLALALLAACATAPREQDHLDTGLPLRQAPVPNIGLFEPERPVPSPESFIALTERQEADFLAYFHSERLASVPKHHRIRDFLTEKLPGFGYLEQTLSSSEALAEHRGNCMSLAALTLALSELVGIETRFQLMNTTPVFDREDGILLSSNHVRSRVYDPDFSPTAGGMIFQRPHLQIDYFPGERMSSGEALSRHGFLAMFYRNLAADALIAGQLDQAFALTQVALALDPDHADSLNLMAVIHRRAGDLVTAESYYRYATFIHANDLSLLSNYNSLLRQMGRYEDAALLESRLAHLDDPNPFHWLDLGEQARARGSLILALRLYEEALARAPYLHEAYWRQAIVYEALGQPQRSMAALERAQSLAQRPESRKSYQSKWQMLKATGAHFNYTD